MANGTQLMQVPRAYKIRAEAFIEAFWFRAIEKHGSPMMSKTQIRQQIRFVVAQCQAEDGDPSTWTPCDHCEDGIYSGRATEVEQKQPDFLDRVQPDGTVSRGMCYQCGGKSKQSEADRRRNWGYRNRKEQSQ